MSTIKKAFKRVQELVKSKWTPKTAEADARRGFGDDLEPYLQAEGEQNSVEVYRHAVDEDLIEALRLPPNYLRKVHLERYGHMILFSDAVLISRDGGVRVFVSGKEVLALRSMV